MGNSPSKNDTLPTASSSTSSSGSGSSGVAGTSDLEPDETAPPLSQSNYITKQGSSKTSAINITKSLSIPEPSYLDSRIKSKNDKVAYKPASKSRKYENDLDLDLEIGASMAKLLKTPAEYGSSVDSDKSDKSDASTMSPVFTTTGEGKDSDLVLSLGSNSPLNKTYFYRNDSKESVNNTVAAISKLDAIAESDSKESTPEPRTKSSTRNLLSTSNLKKHNILKGSPVLAKSLMKVTSGMSSASISPPLIPVNKKLDIDIDSVIDRLLDLGMKKSTRRGKVQSLPVSAHEMKYILRKARSIFLDQPSLLRLSPPVKIIGDIHGQFHDLIRIFNNCGYPPYSNYLFLGDYVDRGHKSLETILLLLSYKIKYPENFFMLRGNHESANITKIYGFYDECKRRLPNTKMWKSFIDVFNTLPIAATINDKIFCIHGGLSPDLVDLKQIESIKRPTDIPDKGLLADLLWSDPDGLIKNFSHTNWPKNDRGVSYCFGKKHVDYFCSSFKIDLIVRGHMVVEDGYEFFNKRKLVTVFSAPNYCGEFNNFGAVMSVDKNLYCSFDLIKPQ